MRKVALSIIVVLLTCSLFAQETGVSNEANQDFAPRGYIGISFGPAFPTGDIDSDAISGGVHLNLVSFGYLFSKHVGIAATWFGTSFVSKNDSKNSIGMGGLLAGPLFSTSTSTGKFEYDFKPMIGFANGTVITNNKASSSDRAIAFGVGGAIRWNCWSKISLSCGIDYYSGKPESVDLSSSALVIGINYRLR